MCQVFARTPLIAKRAPGYSICMPLSEKLRCRYAYEHLPEVDQELHAIETQGWDALDFDTKMASGGDRQWVVEWMRRRALQSLEWVHLDLVGCPDPKNTMGKRQESECAHYREQLKKDQERLADLEARGDEACSDYDLRMGYNAAFNKGLKRNHIIYDLQKLEKCPPVLIEAEIPTQVTTQAPELITRHLRAPEPDEEITVFQQGRLF